MYNPGMRFPRTLVLLAACLGSAGCVAVPVEQQAARPAETRISKNVWQGLDPGGTETQSLHFTVSAYGKDKSAKIAADLEDAYQRIMQDTGLFSFRPGGTYEIVVYANKREYHAKTQTPEWSGGATVGNSIYSYEGLGLSGTLAHEMTHLIFNEFMRGPRGDLTWINEGLAVYEEMQASTPQLKQHWETQLARARENALPFDHMRTLVPSEERAGEASRWYAQAAAVVRFMIEKGGRLGFEALLTSLKDRNPFDTALKGAYPQFWADFRTLELDWLRG
jgi:hypothetical protein